MKRAADEASALFAPFAEEAASAAAQWRIVEDAIREAREGALEFLGDGCPESVWTRYEEENGPLAEIDHGSVIELLWYQLQWAAVREERTLRIPRVIALHMLRDLKARQEGRSARPASRPRRSQLMLRYQAFAVSQVRARKLALIRAGETRADALEIALREIAAAHRARPETVRTWMKNPARLRHPK